MSKTAEDRFLAMRDADRALCREKMQIGTTVYLPEVRGDGGKIHQGVITQREMVSWYDPSWHWINDPNGREMRFHAVFPTHAGVMQMGQTSPGGKFYLERKTALHFLILVLKDRVRETEMKLRERQAALAAFEAELAAEAALAAR